MDYPVIYGQFTVILKDQKWEDSFVTSTLEIEYEQESTRIIYHYQWREWNDFKVSVFVTVSPPLLRFAHSSDHAYLT